VQNPPGAAKAILNSLDGGGEVFASLAEVEPGAIVTVRLTTEEGQTLEKILEREAPEPAEEPTPEPAEEQPDPSTAKAQEAQEDSIADPIADPTSEEQAPEETEKSWAEQNLIWVLVAAGGLLVCIILIAVALRKPAAPPAAALPETWTSPGAPAESARSAPLAYLVMQDAEASRLAIIQTATRIGRRSDNDIVFSNDSVSGHHAEIHMGRDGTFTITDLGSGNGVLVNGQPAKQVGLRDGDIVELGEVRFRFTLQKA
jgi:predicted component of type VI protein secretion system